MSIDILDTRCGARRVTCSMSHAQAIERAKLIATMFQCHAIVARRKAHWAVFRRDFQPTVNGPAECREPRVIVWV